MDIDSFVALGVAICIFGGIFAILRNRGLWVVVSASLFVVTLVSTQLLMKALSSPPYSYKFPGLVTALHFGLVWGVCATYWAAVGESYKSWPSSMGSSKRFARTILPVALSNPLTVVLNNIAMVHIGVGVCAIIGTMSPVAVALLARICGRVQTMLSWAGIFIASVGGAIIVQQEVRSTSLSEASANAGLIFALSSVFVRAVKIVLMDNLLAPAAYQRKSQDPLNAKAEQDLSPMHLYALQAPWCTLVSVAFALSTESIYDAWHSLTPPVVGMILLTTASALPLHFLGIYSLRNLGASLQQIIGKLNTICTMSFSVWLLGETMSGVVVVGSLVVLLGIAIFEHGGKKAHSETLPRR